MPYGRIYRLYDQLIDSVADYHLYILYATYVVLCITKAELTECYMEILTACMHIRWGCEPKHNHTIATPLKYFVWCYKASITSFCGNIPLTWIIVMQILLNNNLHAMGNVKITPYWWCYRLYHTSIALYWVEKQHHKLKIHVTLHSYNWVQLLKLT